MIEDFRKTVIGFADTLTVFKNFLQKRQGEKKSLKAEDLARDFSGPEFTEGLHNAAQDVKILSTLIDKIGVPDAKIISMAKSTALILADRAKVFEHGGYESVQILLAENVNKKPRVTNNEKIIKAILDRLDGREKKK
ncbi:hypothetical protein PV325_013497 [Microctonus aethiopoides]|uniref:Exonuclease domain-containing protein n=1 Tax=Microctonus aethiopoides TaxID=144406 RepID=A0AA39FXP4_9HYME|nr:hypothetical protein PV325_013497 [Microctonus aethiopoides]KAK0177139.1 hypothetical protein PV328_001218 [Microctonus aethiopoides]